MAWTSPKTWISEPLISVDLNSYVRDNQNYLKARIDGTAKQYVRTSSDYTTTSTSLVDVDIMNMALALTTTGNDVLVTFAGFCDAASGNREIQFAVNIDGTPYTVAKHETYTGGVKINMSFSYIFTGLSAISHTFKLQWATQGSTAKLYAGTALFDVREMIGKVA